MLCCWRRQTSGACRLQRKRGVALGGGLNTYFKRPHLDGWIPPMVSMGWYGRGRWDVLVTRPRVCHPHAWHIPLARTTPLWMIGTHRRTAWRSTASSAPPRTGWHVQRSTLARGGMGPVAGGGGSRGSRVCCSVEALTGLDVCAAFNSIGFGNVRGSFWAKSVKDLVILNPAGYMFTSSGFALFIWGIFYRFL